MVLRATAVLARVKSAPLSAPLSRSTRLAHRCKRASAPATLGATHMELCAYVRSFMLLDGRHAAEIHHDEYKENPRVKPAPVV
jgi:hypothetical protein